MSRQLVECVANFSEGRDLRVVDSIVESIRRGPGIAVLDRTSDPDHNRSVITFAGAPEPVAAAAVRAVATAAELIDLTHHQGAHPRMGAADVIPFVPIRGVTLQDCVELAWAAGEEIWKTASVPVYFYEAAARVDGRVRLEQVRSGGFEHLLRVAPNDPGRRPDVGGPGLHPRAGAVAVGARKILIAWNVNLDTQDVAAAEAIARKIRQSSGGLPHVKALGLALPSRRQTQVSMNLTDFEVSPPHVVFEAIRAEAEARGVKIAGSEIIGLFPQGAIELAAAHYLQFENFRPDIVLETRIEQTLPLSLSDVLEEMSERQARSAGGNPAALAGAMAAALGALACRRMQRDASLFLGHRAAFCRAAEAYATANAEGEIEALLAIAERARALVAQLRNLLVAAGAEPAAADVITAVGMAVAAAEGAAGAVESHLHRLGGRGRAAEFERRLQALD